ncbi:spermidine synthase-like [Paramacrobiotus metropolitanus]|uniref:spermidine synthase-like n=1 Tax=Paramacrobiotus metropolitanus TaxID=2943436 RepID=UPI0024460553|nr:spermidine synthase-like [Paramacrobiotus metropolitanus]
MDESRKTGQWFSEVSKETCPGQSFSLEMDDVLDQRKSKYQDILLFQSRTYGKVLVLDGMIQVTERDEFAYQEMMVHMPMFSHPNPQKVLIVGGGDGGILREVVKHDCVQSVVQCEIDEEVINVSRKFLPSLSSAFEHPKFKLHIGDGFEFLKNHQGEFDVIITDSSDPVGPAEGLFGAAYYQLLKNALRTGGIVCSQGESIWLHLDFIKRLMNSCRELFPVVDYASISIPSYPCGQIGAILCGLNPQTNFRSALRAPDEHTGSTWNLRYYTPRVHSTACILPLFAEKELFS